MTYFDQNAAGWATVAAATATTEEFSQSIQAPASTHPAISYPVRANPSLRWTNGDQQKSIFHFADRPDVPYKVDLWRKRFPREIVLVCVVHTVLS